MTAVFVHGVPETPKVWRPLIDALARTDVELLRMPGFGVEVPQGFEPTMDVYARWLARELAARAAPLDLVAHDWGGLLALRVLADRPANVRSWALDSGDLDERFSWHDLAKLWQTPGEGEAFMEGILAVSVEERAALLAANGVPERGATDMAQDIDATMADAILTLYRSATAVGSEWGPGIDAIEGSGLVIGSGQDPFRAPGRAERLAERTGATFVDLPDAGHWWMLEDPERAATVLTEFWATR